MSNSYSRTCKWCGRRIHMRQMPAGQWVAFEGFDTLHNCSGSNANLTRTTNSRKSNSLPRSSGNLNPQWSFNPSKPAKTQTDWSSIIFVLGAIVLAIWLCGQ